MYTPDNESPKKRWSQNRSRVSGAISNISSDVAQEYEGQLSRMA